MNDQYITYVVDDRYTNEEYPYADFQFKIPIEDNSSYILYPSQVYLHLDNTNVIYADNKTLFLYGDETYNYLVEHNFFNKSLQKLCFVSNVLEFKQYIHKYVLKALYVQTLMTYQSYLNNFFLKKNLINSIYVLYNIDTKILNIILLDSNKEMFNVYNRIFKAIQDLHTFVGVYQNSQINENYNIALNLPSHDFFTVFIKKLQKIISNEKNKVINFKIYCYHPFYRKYNIEDSYDIQKLCKLFDDNYKYYKLNTDNFNVLKNNESKCKVSIIGADYFLNNDNSTVLRFLKDFTEQSEFNKEVIQQIPFKINYNDYFIAIDNGPNEIVDNVNFKVNKNHSLKINKYFNTINISIFNNNFTSIDWFPNNYLIVQFHLKKENDSE